MGLSERSPSQGPIADSTLGIQALVTAAVDKYLKSTANVGLAVGVITESESHSFCFGSQGAGEPPPFEDSIFEIGSITKLFTATLLADMHLQGEVSLDDPVNQFLPQPARLPSHKGVEITLRHLATHTSGLPRLPVNLDLKRVNPDNPYAAYTVDDLYACLGTTRLRSLPGTRTDYSNLGTGLLGHVLASAADSDYETLIKRRICEPLGMRDTAIHLSDDQRLRLLSGHSGGRPVPNWDLPTLAGAGAFRSTLRDMLRFLRANVDPPSGPLRKALELSHELQFERRYRVSRDFGVMAPLIAAGLAGLLTWQSFGLPVWARVAAVLATPALLFRFWPVGLSTIALGWHVDEMSFNTPVLWHNGGTGGYASYIAFFRQWPFGVVLLANSDNGPDSAGQTLLQHLEPGPAALAQ